MLDWKIIHECDTDDNEPTCFCAEINSKKYGKYVWITQNENDEWNVEVSSGGFNGDIIRTLIACKSVVSAKRWVARYLL